MVMLDKAYKYVGDMYAEAKRAGSAEKARDLNNLRLELENAITDKVPVYKKALDTFSGESALKDALEMGNARFLQKTPSQINREIAQLKNEGEKEMYRLGAIQNLRDDIYSQKETANIADKYLSKGIMKDRLQTVFGPAEGVGPLLPNQTFNYEGLIKNLDRERQMAITRSRVEGGSPTARIEQDIADITGPAPTELLGAGVQMLRGDLMGGASNLMRQAGSRMQGINANVAEEIARRTLGTNAAEQNAYLMGLNPVMDELMRRAMQQQTRAAGYSASAGGAVPGLLGD